MLKKLQDGGLWCHPPPRGQTATVGLALPKAGQWWWAHSNGGHSDSELGTHTELKVELVRDVLVGQKDPRGKIAHLVFHPKAQAQG